jgi:polysaccharide deacetylase family protein (PEP-CTERM system associated)
MSVLNTLSIDVEDWYQGLTSTSRRFEEWDQFEQRIGMTLPPLLDMLSEFRVKATFFVLGHIAQLHPELVKRILAQGHEIGTHGFRHRLVHEMTPQEFRADVQQSIELLQDVTGTRIYGHRAPAASIDARTPWAFQVLEDLGLSYDSSIISAKTPLYGWPGAPRFPYRLPSAKNLVEFPGSTIKIGKWNLPVGGGFYMRAYPLPLTKWAIRRINDQGQPAMVYFHPWELDPEHPKPAHVTVRERVSHYYNLQRAGNKLTEILKSFQFVPLIKLLEHIEV